MSDGIIDGGRTLVTDALYYHARRAWRPTATIPPTDWPVKANASRGALIAYIERLERASRIRRAPRITLALWRRRVGHDWAAGR